MPLPTEPKLERAQQPIKVGVIMTFGVISLIIIFIFIGILAVQSIQKPDTSLVAASSRNNQYSQQIPLLADRVMTGDLEAQVQLRRIIDDYDASLVALRFGGVAPGIWDNETLPSAPQSFSGLFDNNELIWEEFQPHAIRIAEATQSDITNRDPALELSHAFVISQSHRLLSSGQELLNAFSDLSDRKQQLFSITVIIVGLFSLATLYLGFYRIEQVSLRIYQFIDTIRRVKEKNFSYSIPVTSDDEIGQMTEVFNELIDQVNVTYDEFRKKVKEKTVSLEKALATTQQQNTELERTKLAMLNVLEDIKEQKQANEEQKNKLKTILDHLPVGVGIITAPQGQFEFVNEYTRSLFEWPRNISEHETNYSQAYDMLREDGSPYPVQELPITETLKSKTLSERSDMFIRNSDGERRALHVASAPVLSDSGNLTSVVATFQDITREAEIDQAKTEFVSLASHQLRTPLAAINWYAEMLLAGDAGRITKKQKKYLNEIYNGNQRMIALINSLLNVSRLELGMFSVTPTNVDIEELVDLIVKGNQSNATMRDITIDFSTEGKLPILKADPHLLEMVVDNIIANAVKYSQEGSHVVTQLSLAGAGDDIAGTTLASDSIVLQVKDSGIGIPSSAKGHLFSKMYRADNAKQTDVGGTGLGLYIVKSIMDEVGGQVWYESEESQGTTFYVALPLTGMRSRRNDKTLV